MHVGLETRKKLHYAFILKWSSFLLFYLVCTFLICVSATPRLCNWSLLQPSATTHSSVFFFSFCVAGSKTIARQTQLALCDGGLQSFDFLVIGCNNLLRELKQCARRSPFSFNRDASFSSLFLQFSWFSQYLVLDGYALFLCLLFALWISSGVST